MIKGETIKGRSSIPIQQVVAGVPSVTSCSLIKILKEKLVS